MNQDNRKQVIIASALGVVLVGVFAYQFYSFFLAAEPEGGPAASKKIAARDTGTPGARVTPNSPVQPMTLKKDEVNLDILLGDVEVVNFDYALSRIERNPMTPLIAQIYPQRDGQGRDLGGTIEEPGIPFVLRKKVTGIIYDEYNPMAVVDDEVVSLGKTYPSGIQVYSIERDRVVFKLGDALIPVEIEEL